MSDGLLSEELTDAPRMESPDAAAPLAEPSSVLPQPPASLRAETLKAEGVEQALGPLSPEEAVKASPILSAERTNGPVPAHPSPGTPLGQMLVEYGILSEEQVEMAQEQAWREGLSLARIVVRNGLVLFRDLAALYSLHLGVSVVDLRSYPIDPQAVALLPEEIARRDQVLPFANNGRLRVAMTDPLDFRLIHGLQVRTGSVIEPVIASPEDIIEHIDLAYRLAEAAEEEPEASGHKVRVSDKAMQDASPAEVVDILLRRAVQDRASDIHIDPTESYLRIRFRIDGILHDILSLPLQMAPVVVSRLKIMAGLNIAERRRPQDGQITVEVQGRKLDVRVAVSACIAGEMAVLRLLDKRSTLLVLDQLGMSPTVHDLYKRLLQLPYGMVIVCGPTGAGKSTTLNASVLQMNRKESNVISLEDPVEYRIPDTNQMQMKPEAGITFATQLRSVLRLDPDVIVVGEIRDQETAVIAVQAALTGHLVLTSLHANDAVSALLRLRDLGVPPYLIASSVAGIVSQRMVRVVCAGCRELKPRPLAEQKMYAAETGEARETFVYGGGCNLCAQTGYRGRTGVFEGIALSDELRRLVLTDAPRSQFWEQALKDGMVPLRRDGMLKVQQGVTTPYEVSRVLFSLD